MDKIDIINYYVGEVRSGIADLHQELASSITTIERSHAAKGTVKSGGFVHDIQCAYISILDSAVKLIFSKARDMVIDFDVEFDDDFKSKMVELLDAYFSSLSMMCSLERYFGRFGQAADDMLRPGHFAHKISSVECWYKNNIEPFTFKLRREVSRMKEEKCAKHGFVVHAYNSNVVNAHNSNVQIGQNSSAYTIDAVSAMEALVAYLRENKVHESDEEQDDLVAALKDAKEEVKKEKPSRFKLFAILDGAGKLVGQVPQYVAACEAIKKLF